MPLGKTGSDHSLNSSCATIDDNAVVEVPFYLMRDAVQDSHPIYGHRLETQIGPTSRSGGSYHPGIILIHENGSLFDNHRVFRVASFAIAGLVDPMVRFSTTADYAYRSGSAGVAFAVGRKMALAKRDFIHSAPSIGRVSGMAYFSLHPAVPRTGKKLSFSYLCSPELSSRNGCGRKITGTPT
jgi:hypothetical protein